MSGRYVTRTPVRRKPWVKTHGYDSLSLRDTGENIVEMCELYRCPQYHILYALELISQPGAGMSPLLMADDAVSGLRRGDIPVALLTIVPVLTPDAEARSGGSRARSRLRRIRCRC